MCRKQFRAVLLLCVLLFGVGVMPGASWAQAATPTAPQNDFPPEFCTPEQIANGEMNIKESPEVDALVSPAASPNMDLYVVTITMPANSCVSFTGHNLHDGAVIWLVESGEITFAYEPIPNWPLPDVRFQLKDGTTETGSKRMDLLEGGWVSADRAIHYSYLNASGDEAIITMAVVENRAIFIPHTSGSVTFDASGCKGVCRRR
ncbi:MAG: hypothetical protein U0075_05250 [Thermomicrobiales bacterium]